MSSTVYDFKKNEALVTPQSPGQVFSFTSAGEGGAGADGGAILPHSRIRRITALMAYEM